MCHLVYKLNRYEPEDQRTRGGKHTSEKLVLKGINLQFKLIRSTLMRERKPYFNLHKIWANP